MIIRRGLRLCRPRHPLTQALWLEARGRLLFLVERERRWLSLLAVVVALAGVGAAVTVPARSLSWLTQQAGSHLATLGILVALQTSLLVHRNRRKWSDFYRSGWLSAIPLRPNEITRMVALRSCLVPGLLVALLLAGVALAGAIAGKSSLEANTAGLAPLAGVAAAAFTGGMLGWFLPHQNARVFRPVLLSLRSSGSDAGLTSLSLWVTTQARVWLQPRFLARILLPALLALPMDVSANVAIGVLAIWTIAVYLLVLLRATVVVARRGAVWLRPTPVSVSRFAWAVARTPTLKQLQWTVITAGLLIALGLKPAWAVRAAEWWFALVTITSGITIAQAQRSGSWRVRLLLSMSTLAVLERIKEYAALPAALLICAWHLRRAARP